MKFSRTHQPKHRNGGRRLAPATIEKRQSEAIAERERQIKAFERFENAKGGTFDGFEFVGVFHERINKDAAIYSGISDDCADVKTPFGIFHTGADGVTAYFFSKSPVKTVQFNRSIYFF